MRTDQALKAILLDALDVMLANERSIIEEADRESLHDFRVAVRRSRSLLGQINGVFPQRPLQRFRSGLKWLGTFTGPARDLQVYLMKFPRYRACLPRPMQPHLDALRPFLEKLLRQEHAVLVGTLQSPRHQILKARWREFLLAPVPQRTRLANAALPVKQTADAHIWKSFHKVLKQGRAITRKCPDEKLHRLRISCKKLRYLLECFHSLYADRKLHPLIRSLKKLQDVLGDFQDLSVQIESLDAMQQQMREENLMTEKTHQAMDLLAVKFHQQKQDIREKFFDIFAGFSTARHVDLYRQLFKSVAPETPKL